MRSTGRSTRGTSIPIFLGLSLAFVVLLSAGFTGAAHADASNVFMQVGAHPDDDLLFMNPDLQNILGSGQGAVTIMMTAAEADGGVDGTPKAQFAGQRQEGLRAAYAYMTGVSNSWTRSAVFVVDRWIEYDTLNPAPQVRLLFINLPDGGDPDLHPTRSAASDHGRRSATASRRSPRLRRSPR